MNTQAMYTQAMNPQRVRTWARSLAPACLLALGLLLFTVRPALAQPPDCSTITTQLDSSLTPAACLKMGFGSACLANISVTAVPRTGTLRFTRQGDQALLGNLNSMTTLPQNGSALMLGGTAANPVKILVFGDANTNTGVNQPARVFTVRTKNGTPTCERTRSGVILQTPTGQTGSVVVNGVTIQLGSTAYIVPGADLMFDQDPRIDRRQGRRNPNAPLCSGFDSDCDFGDDQCRSSDRLVWGPYCREDSYPYIAEGLYRVTLYGEGRVKAGATDYGLEHTYDTMGSQEFNLPGSYTFCWEGMQPGGTGFETIVQARSSNARVDHITLEYLGRNCNQRANAFATSGNSQMSMMTVYNVEGGVGINMNGQEQEPGGGQRMRVYYRNGQPVAMDDEPTDAPYIMESDLVQWAAGTTGSGLPEIQVVTSTQPVTPTAPPVVQLAVDLLRDGATPYAVRIEATAYDPAVDTANGSGIRQVAFVVSDPNGDAIYRHTETAAPYCAFGGDSSPCDAPSLYAANGLGLDRLPLSGEYTVVATALTQSGRRASAQTSFTLDFGPTSDGGASSYDATPPTIDNINAQPGETACAGGALSVTAQVQDDGSGVANVQLWYKMNSSEGSADYVSTAMSGDGDVYTAQVEDLSGDSLDYYIIVHDNDGYDTQSETYSVPIVACPR